MHHSHLERSPASQYSGLTCTHCKILTTCPTMRHYASRVSKLLSAMWPPSLRMSYPHWDKAKDFHSPIRVTLPELAIRENTLELRCLSLSLSLSLSLCLSLPLRKVNVDLFLILYGISGRGTNFLVIRLLARGRSIESTWGWIYEGFCSIHPLWFLSFSLPFSL